KEWTLVANFNWYPPTQDPGTAFGQYNIGQLPPYYNDYTLDGSVWQIPGYYTIDVQVSYEFGKGKIEGRKWYDGTKLVVGCNNVTDEQPPLVPDAIESNTDKNTYDVIGRFLYFEIDKKF